MAPTSARGGKGSSSSARPKRSSNVPTAKPTREHSQSGHVPSGRMGPPPKPNGKRIRSGTPTGTYHDEYSSGANPSESDPSQNGHRPYSSAGFGSSDDHGSQGEGRRIAYPGSKNQKRRKLHEFASDTQTDLPDFSDTSLCRDDGRFERPYGHSLSGYESSRDSRGHRRKPKARLTPLREKDEALLEVFKVCRSKLTIAVLFENPMYDAGQIGGMIEKTWRRALEEYCGTRSIPSSWQADDDMPEHGRNFFNHIRSGYLSNSKSVIERLYLPSAGGADTSATAKMVQELVACDSFLCIPNFPGSYFMAPQIPELIYEVYFRGNHPRSREVPQFLERAEESDSFLCLTAAIIRHCLDEWKDGIHKSGPAFTTQLAWENFQRFQKTLDGLDRDLKANLKRLIRRNLRACLLKNNSLPVSTTNTEGHTFSAEAIALLSAPDLPDPSRPRPVHDAELEEVNQFLQKEIGQQSRQEGERSDLSPSGKGVQEGADDDDYEEEDEDDRGGSGTTLREGHVTDHDDEEGGGEEDSSRSASVVGEELDEEEDSLVPK